MYRHSAFPAEYQGAYFYADSTRDFVRYLKFDADGALAPNPSPDPISSQNPDSMSYSFDLAPVGRIVAIEQGPEGALYYLSFTDSGGAYGQPNPSVLGSLRRFVYEVENLRPAISTFTVTPTSGGAPLAAQFDVQASDPEGAPLTFWIDFGDGASSAQSPLESGTAVTVDYTYESSGDFKATLHVSDGNKETRSNASIEVGSVPVIESLTAINDRTGQNGGLFRYGDTITFSATATDNEDGPLDASAFVWNVAFVRPGNIHPTLGPVEDVDSIDFPIPSQGQGFSGDVYYQAQVTVTDSDGLTAEQTVDVYPEKAVIHFETQPAGIVVQVNGNTAVQAPHDLDTLVNWDHTIAVPPYVCIDGVAYAFDHWSNGETTNQFSMVMPAEDISLTAVYTEDGTCEADAPPNIVENPVDATVYEGQPTDIAVSVRTFSPTDYQWEVSTDGGASWSPIADATFDNLHVEYPSLLQNGQQFRCLISNPHGSATSEAATLTVIPRPTLTIAKTSETTFQLTTDGDSTLDTFIIQRSTNLTNWETISDELNFNELSEPFTLSIEVEPSAPAFFRLAPVD